MSIPAFQVAPAAPVYVLHNAGDAFARRYERAARAAMAAQLAALRGSRYGGEWDAAAGAAPGSAYFVPDDTLSADQAMALGIRDEADLFGGVVPFPFLATKALTQPLVDGAAAAPDGWQEAFHAGTDDAVLRGFCAFCIADALRGLERLLQGGPVRIKPVRGTGGRGQRVVADMAAGEEALAALDAAALARDGVVLEENLADATTLSIGRVRVGALQASYHGRQHETRDQRGQVAYGGSALTLWRGDFDALLARPLQPAERVAVEQARRYDARARELWPQLLVSRCNYDVAQGRDGAGRARSGVLEQSWRIGGASPAELLGLATLQARPRLDWVRVDCREVHGPCSPPKDAVVLFAGKDPEAGVITLYARVEAAGPD